MHHTTLNKKEQRTMRRWFTKIDDDTLEIKVKRNGLLKIFLSIILGISIYYNFAVPKYREQTIDDLKFAFVPSSRFEKEWLRDRDLNNPGYSMFGEKKEDYMNGMWEFHKSSVWHGYFIVAPFVMTLLCFLWPSKGRIRLDRKRGIIYTHTRGKLHLTEINKLMRPLPEFIVNQQNCITLWIHPYKQPKILPELPHPSIAQYILVDSTMWLPALAFIFFICPIMLVLIQIPLTRNLGFYIARVLKMSTAPTLQKLIVDYMNPELDTKRFDEMLLALEQSPTFSERCANFIMAIFDKGLFCRALPKQEQLEKEIEDYFKNDAPHIDALPSWEMKKDGLYFNLKKKFMDIVPIEENKEWGWEKAPCDNLFEPTERTVHYNAFTEMAAAIDIYNKERNTSKK